MSAVIDDRSVRELQVSPATELVGEIVTWDVGSAKGITYSDVMNALSASGLDPDSASELSPRNAFSRACKELKKQRVIRKLDDQTDVIKFQFTTENLHQNKFEYDYEASLELNKHTGIIYCPESVDLAQHAQDLLNEALVNRTAADVTRLVQKLFGKNGDLFPINPHKGVAYFVPNQFKEFTSKIEQFMETLGGKIWRFPVPKGTSSGDSAVRDAVKNGIRQMIQDLVDTCNGWTDTTRDSTMHNRFKDFKMIEFKVNAYSQFLSYEREKIEHALELAKRRMVERVKEVKNI